MVSGCGQLEHPDQQHLCHIVEGKGVWSVAGLDP